MWIINLKNIFVNKFYIIMNSDEVFICFVYENKVFVRLALQRYYWILDHSDHFNVVCKNDRDSDIRISRTRYNNKPRDALKRFLEKKKKASYFISELFFITLPINLFIDIYNKITASIAQVFFHSWNKYYGQRKNTNRCCCISETF